MLLRQISVIVLLKKICFPFRGGKIKEKLKTNISNNAEQSSNKLTLLKHYQNFPLTKSCRQELKYENGLLFFQVSVSV